jgi:quercetin dioxygenase-like cupin family protein
MADGRSEEISAGEVIITRAGEVHGVSNTGEEPFIYLSVTTPPEDFTTAYKRRL